MAKKKLFGNAPEPRCETCAHGRASSEGDVILCKRAGAVPPHHHCRRFLYDPLKRVPHRTKPLEMFDDEAFSLEIVAEPAEVVPPEVIEAEKAVQEELIDQTLVVEAETATDIDDPDEVIDQAPIVEAAIATDIDEPDEVIDQAPVVEAEATDAAKVIDEAATAQPEEPDAIIETDAAIEPEKDYIDAPIPDEVVVPDETAETEQESKSLVPDNTDDIFGDLARLNVEVLKSATHAAFQHFDPKMMAFEEYKAEDIDPEAVKGFDPSLVMLHDPGDNDDAPLASNDLILLNKAALDDSLDDTEMLTMNPDGTFSGHSAE